MAQASQAIGIMGPSDPMHGTLRVTAVGDAMADYAEDDADSDSNSDDSSDDAKPGKGGSGARRKRKKAKKRDHVVIALYPEWASIFTRKGGGIDAGGGVF